MTPFYGYRAAGWWKNERGANLLDGAAHFYRVYRTRDDRFVAVGAIEPQFYALLLDGLGLSDDAEFARQNDESLWPHLSRRLEDIFSQKTRDEWCGIFEGTDACFAPVLDLDEAPSHPIAASRSSFLSLGGKVVPAPAPRYSVTKLEPPRPTIDVHNPG
jgi:alpha-methylacyl-CoA racemase